MRQNNSDHLINIISRVLTPFIISFAFYIQINGSDGPGGGFQAGAILSSVLVVINILLGHKTTLTIITFRQLKFIASTGVILFMFPGVIAIFLDKNFLNYFALEKFTTTPQSIGIGIIEWGVGFTVFASLSLIYLKIATRGSKYAGE